MRIGAIGGMLGKVGGGGGGKGGGNPMEMVSQLVEMLKGGAGGAK